MKIGQYDLYSIETSEFSLDGGAMFGIIPKTLWKEKFSSDRLNRVDMVTRSLLLVNGDRKVLIDTGNGSKWAKKYLDMYNIDFSKYNIFSSLKKMCDEEWISFFEYDPFYQSCKIEMKGKYYGIKSIVKISE